MGVSIYRLSRSSDDALTLGTNETTTSGKTPTGTKKRQRVKKTRTVTDVATGQQVVEEYTEEASSSLTEEEEDVVVQFEDVTLPPHPNKKVADEGFTKVDEVSAGSKKVEIYLPNGPKVSLDILPEEELLAKGLASPSSEATATSTLAPAFQYLEQHKANQPPKLQDRPLSVIRAKKNKAEDAKKAAEDAKKDAADGKKNSNADGADAKSGTNKPSDPADNKPASPSKKKGEDIFELKKQQLAALEAQNAKTPEQLEKEKQEKLDKDAKAVKRTPEEEAQEQQRIAEEEAKKKAKEDEEKEEERKKKEEEAAKKKKEDEEKNKKKLEAWEELAEWTLNNADELVKLVEKDKNKTPEQLKREVETRRAEIQNMPVGVKELAETQFYNDLKEKKQEYEDKSW